MSLPGKDRKPLMVAWGHAMALLKGLRGGPLEPQAQGLIKALSEMREEVSSRP